MNRAARTTLSCVVATVLVYAAAPVAQQSAEMALRAAIETETVKGDINSAIEQYRKLADGGNRVVAAQALVHMAEAYQRMGNAEAERIYDRVIRDFADQAATIAMARERLRALRTPDRGTLSQMARQVWTGEGVDGSGSPTLDGRYLSFQQASGDLALRDLVANTTRRLTDTGGWAASGDYTARSAMAPDGRQVAYHWFVEKDGATELRLMALRGNEPVSPRVLLRVNRPEYIEPFALTPDGSQVVVVRTLPDRANQLGVVSTKDGSYRSIKSLEWRYPQGVRLSPDGRYVAYDVPAGDAGSLRDIFVLALDGSREVPAVTGPSDDRHPIWTADGSRLVFQSIRGGNPSLWSVAVDAGRVVGSPSLVKPDTGPIVPLGISRTGALYYQSFGASSRNVYAAPVENLKVTRAPAAVSEQFADQSSGPAWSPDGQALAYYSFRGRPTLVIRSVSNGAERTVELPQGLEAPFESGPRWFPDGRFVLVLAREPQGPGRVFHRVNVDTGGADRLHRIATGTSSFTLSRDGRTIFWAVQNMGELRPSGRLMRYDIAASRETVLKRDEWFIAVALSPDGTQLAYLKSIRTDEERRRKEYPSVIEVMPATGGDSRQVFRDAIWLSGHRYNTLGWTSDGRFLMFVRDDGRLWRVSAAGGEPQEMGISLPGGESGRTRIKAPTIHPDGTRLVFGVAERPNNEIWALENFLPALNASK